jgi:glyoxylase-like metal-dependent hydrolase (beta-lactamase superfamily II)
VVERRQLGRGGAALRWLDEFEHGFGWVPQDDKLRRTSHALIADGVWLVDPVDGDALDDRVRAAGEPAGVIQLLDRHARDCTAVAARLGVQHHVVPRQRVGPFAFVDVMQWSKWREVALWWSDQRVLVCADALGTIGYFRARNEDIGVHPFLRLLKPPKALAELPADRVLVGHGSGVTTTGGAAVREAVRTARRRLPAALAHAVRSG